MGSPVTRRRFVQEAKTASALNHPNIVHIYDIATADTPLGAVGYIAMEYVAGEPLSDVIPRKGLPFAKALRIYGPAPDRPVVDPVGV